MALDPTAPITRLTGLAFTDEDGINSSSVLYPPNLTSAEIAAIDIATLDPGAVVFDKTTEELTTLTAAGFWLPILTAESDITVTDLDVTGTATIATADITTSTTITANINTLNGAVANLVSADITNGSINFLQSGFINSDVIAASCPSTGISPLTVTLDTGAGTGATALIKGSLMSGTFQLNVGTSPQAGGIIGTFTIPPSLVSHFSGDFGVAFMPASPSTSSIPTYVTTASPSGQFLFALGPVTLTSPGQYFWNYLIIGTKKSV